MKSRNTLSIIADDFTGAVDTAVCFSKEGFQTSFSLTADGMKLSDVKVINTDSRNKEDQTFIDYIYPRLEEIRLSKWKFKKIDSTLRGQVGQEIEALMNLLELDAALIVPAFPKAGRTVREGILYLHGIPLHLSDVAEDFATPLPNSYVHGIIANQTDLPIGTISYDHIQAAERINIKEEILAMQAKGIKLICFDTVDDSDMEKIFGVFLQLYEEGKNFLWVGSAGLAESICKHMSRNTDLSPYPLTNLQHFNSNLVIVNGSKKNLSHDQVEALCRSFSLTKLEIINNQESNMQDYQPSTDVYILTSPKSTTASVPCKTISESLAKLVKQICENRETSRMILVGGDTAWKIINVLGTKHVEILGEIETAVPYGILHLHNDKKILFISKGGSIGNHETLIKVYKFLEKIS